MSNATEIEMLVQGLVNSIGSDPRKLAAVKSICEAKTDVNSLVASPLLDQTMINLIKGLHRAYNGKYKFYSYVACNCTFENEENTKEIDSLNWDSYSVAHNFGFSIQQTVKEGKLNSILSLEGRDYPVVNTIPIFKDPVVSTFLNVRAALEVASVVSVDYLNPSTGQEKTIESVNLANASSAKSLITPKVVTTIGTIKAVAGAVHSKRKLVEHARELMPLLTQPNIQTFIHSTLVKPYCDSIKMLYPKDTARYFTRPDNYSFAIKERLIPTVPEDISIGAVAGYLAVSRNFRCADDNGFSGMSCGYAYGVSMKKETADMLDKLSFLQVIRNVYVGRTLVIYGCSAMESRYILTNVEWPLIISGNTNYVQSAEAYVTSIPIVKDGDVTIDFSCTSLKMGKEHTDEARKAIFLADFEKYKKLKAIYYKAYIFSGSDVNFIPLRSSHNMVVMYTNDNSIKPVVNKYTYLKRVYLANYIRNNWFSHVCRFSTLLGQKEFTFVVKTPYSVNTKKFIEMGDTLGTEEDDNYHLENSRYLEQLGNIEMPPDDYCGGAISSASTTTSSGVSNHPRFNPPDDESKGKEPESKQLSVAETFSESMLKIETGTNAVETNINNVEDNETDELNDDSEEEEQLDDHTRSVKSLPIVGQIEIPDNL